MNQSNKHGLPQATLVRVARGFFCEHKRRMTPDDLAAMDLEWAKWYLHVGREAAAARQANVTTAVQASPEPEPALEAIEAAQASEVDQVQYHDEVQADISAEQEANPKPTRNYRKLATLSLVGCGLAALAVFVAVGFLKPDVIPPLAASNAASTETAQNPANSGGYGQVMSANDTAKPAAPAPPTPPTTATAVPAAANKPPTPPAANKATTVTPAAITPNPQPSPATLPATHTTPTQPAAIEQTPAQSPSGATPSDNTQTPPATTATTCDQTTQPPC